MAHEFGVHVVGDLAVTDEVISGAEKSSAPTREAVLSLLYCLDVGGGEPGFLAQVLVVLQLVLRIPQGSHAQDDQLRFLAGENTKGHEHPRIHQPRQEVAARAAHRREEVERLAALHEAPDTVR